VLVLIGVNGLPLINYPILDNFIFINNASDCYAPLNRDNQCLACYLRRGCMACEVDNNVYQCLPTVRYTPSGPVFGNETCRALNTTFGSYRVGPVDCFWEGLGDWIFKLTNRRDIRLWDEDIIDIETRTAAYLARIHSIIDPLINQSGASVSVAEVEEFIARVKLLISAKASNITVEVVDSFARWDIDTAENNNFTDNLRERLYELKVARFSAENSSDLGKALLTAEYVKAHHTLSTFHYCWAAQRLRERLALHDVLSNLLEDIHIWELFTALQDVNELQAEYNLCLVLNCTWNGTVAKFITESIATAKLDILQYILEAEEFKAYIDVLTIKVSALVERKCVRELHILADLDAIIKKLESGYYAAIADLRADTSNDTTVADIIDVFMDFMEEIEDINATIITAANHLTWQWRIKQDLESVAEGIVVIGEDFCRALRAYMIAHFGIEPTGHVCDPTSAQQVKKRQEALDTNQLAVTYGINTQTDGTGSTGTLVLIPIVTIAVSLIGILML